MMSLAETLDMLSGKVIKLIFIYHIHEFDHRYPRD